MRFLTFWGIPDMINHVLLTPLASSPPPHFGNSFRSCQKIDFYARTFGRLTVLTLQAATDVISFIQFLIDF
jgi:hypothetical protein